jgi:hypothetical protein
MSQDKTESIQILQLTEKNTYRAITSLLPNSNIYNAYNWTFDPKIDHNIALNWSTSNTFQPTNALLYLIPEIEFNHNDIWESYVSPNFDTNYFDWRTVMNRYPITLKHFFLTQQIDTPTTLKLKQSKFRPFFFQASSRLVGMLARHGRHPTIKLNYFSVYNTLVRNLMYPTHSSSDLFKSTSLINLLLRLPTEKFSSNQHNFEINTFELLLKKRKKENVTKSSHYGHTLNTNYLHLDIENVFYKILFQLLKQYYPMFSMKARKVDKLKFKHSRGKSGKYMVEWRYVPRYRRLSVVLRWFVEDVIMQKAPTSKQQLFSSLNLLLTNPNEHIVAKNRNYVHNYVYSRYRHTLLRSLRRVIN